ncbi:MAG: carboxypeptidase regulatory-like domain-containing protein [Acidobacteria bacterium]|nr:carboxypeptidase regulatory-like domain-containing protein [Acidobacteriota bacterium]
MKLAAYLSLASLLAAQPAAPPRGGAGRRPVPAVEKTPTKPEDLCALEGQVLNSVTGEPIRKAALTLRPVEFRGSEPQASTGTDAGGTFAMKGIEPGKYRLWVERNGFVRQEYGARSSGRPGTTLTLEKGQKLKGLVFKLVPHSVITGRIVDEEGEPVANVAVQVMRTGFLQGRRQLMPMGGAQTNDLGEYRIYGIAPGKYYLSAVYRRMNMFGGTVDRSAGEAPPDESYAPTYYPGSTDPAAAAQLDIPSGGEVRGISLSLQRTRTVRVRGKVVNPGGRLAGGAVFLTPRGPSVGMMSMMQRNATNWQQATGAFEIRGVTPGSYTLAADLFQENKRMTARLPLEVGGSNVDELVLTFTPGGELQGTVKIDGQAETSLGEINVSLRPREMQFFGGASGGRVKEDGTFALQGVAQENYTLSVFGMPPGFYLKAARLGDLDALEKGLDFTQGVGAGAMEVVISAAGGQVEGVVMDAKQQPAPGATVVLAPDADRRSQSHLFKTVTTDQNGRYTIQGIAPGDYQLFAFEDVERGGEQDPEYLKPFEKSAEKITIRENGRESKQLKQIPAES